jgi:hypothetical protein
LREPLTVLLSRDTFSPASAQLELRKDQLQTCGRVLQEIGESLEVRLDARRFARHQPEFEVDMHQLDQHSTAKGLIGREQLGNRGTAPCPPARPESTDDSVQVGPLLGGKACDML